MAVQIQSRRDIAANWTSINPTLADGEIGIETDTVQIKIGDGLTLWDSLSYLSSSSSGDGSLVIQDNKLFRPAFPDTYILFGDNTIMIAVNGALQVGWS